MILKGGLKSEYNPEWFQCLSFSENIYLKKLKTLLRRSVLKQHTQWLSCKVVVTQFNKSEQVSKVCSMLNFSSYPMHIYGSSPLNKKEWVIKEWQWTSRLWRRVVIKRLPLSDHVVCRSSGCFWWKPPPCFVSLRGRTWKGYHLFKSLAWAERPCQHQSQFRPSDEVNDNNQFSPAVFRLQPTASRLSSNGAVVCTCWQLTAMITRLSSNGAAVCTVPTTHCSDYNLSWICLLFFFFLFSFFSFLMVDEKTALRVKVITRCCTQPTGK